MSNDPTACPNKSTCPMFELFMHAGTLSVWQTNYCLSAFETCARYKLGLEARSVPLNLLPSGALLRKAR